MIFRRHPEGLAERKAALRLELARAHARLSSIRKVAMNPRLEFSPEIDREYREAADAFQDRMNRWMKLYPGERALYVLDHERVQEEEA